MENTILDFRWSVSRGRNTYGYNICSLWINDKKVNSCSGGGYDMEGTCFGNWIASAFTEQLKRLKPNYGSRDRVKGFYGLRFWRKNKSVRKYKDGDTIQLDGGCGFESMRRILKKLGFGARMLSNTTNQTIYLIHKP